jgi:hypothetical protein
MILITPSVNGANGEILGVKVQFGKNSELSRVGFHARAET